MKRKVKLTAEIDGKRYACVPSNGCSGCAFEPECGGSNWCNHAPMPESAYGLLGPCVELGFRYEELPSATGEGGAVMRPFYVIRILRDGQRPVYWRSQSSMATPLLGEATVFRNLGAAVNVKQTVQTWTAGVIEVEVVAVNLESIMKES